MKLVFASIFLLLSVPAWAIPGSGTLKELGETPLADEIGQTGAKSTPVSLPAGDAGSVSAYGQLDPFDEMAILQRKFLPKRHRLELGLAYGQLVDNAFFETQTYFARVAYSFSETMAAEFLGFSSETKKNNVSHNLEVNGPVLSGISSVPKGYYGLDFKWSPIFGKLAFWNFAVVPVEQYLVLGVGTTENIGAKPSFTRHMGTGFSFGVYKWLAVRFGIDLFSYGTEHGDHFDDTHLNLGLSAFLPRAEYR